MASRPLAKTTTEDVRRYLAARVGEIARATQAHELSHLRSFFGVLLAEELVAADPTEGLTVHRGSLAPRLLLAVEAVRRVFDAALIERTGSKLRAKALALRDRAVVELLYGLGLRASEVVAARVVDLDLVAGTLFTRRAKRGADAMLPLPPSSLPHLTRYLTEARPCLAAAHGLDEGRLILTKSGRPLHPAYVGRIVARAGDLVGLRVFPHALRRALASHLVREGVPLRAVQELLGHVRLVTTQNYVQVEADDLRRAVELLNLSDE